MAQRLGHRPSPERIGFGLDRIEHLAAVKVLDQLRQVRQPLAGGSFMRAATARLRFSSPRASLLLTGQGPFLKVEVKDAHGHHHLGGVATLAPDPGPASVGA